MVLVEDNEEVNPTVPLPQFHYIQDLQDTHQLYTRYFDALLIARPSHRAFFRDLRAFRSQPTIIAILSSCTPSSDPDGPSKEVIKQKYRLVTSAFLGSRFAHPWCRKSMAGDSAKTSRGWFGAEWGATGRKMSEKQKEEENKLHKLLVPIWIIMRAKMFPGDEFVRSYHEEKLAKEEELKRKAEMSKEEGVEEWLGAVEMTDGSSKGNERDSGYSTGPTTPVAGDEKKRLKVPTMSVGRPLTEGGATTTATPKQTKSYTNMRQDFWDSEEGEEFRRGEELQRDREAASVATGVVRVAALAALATTTIPKWKLKRLMKKMG